MTVPRCRAEISIDECTTAIRLPHFGLFFLSSCHGFQTLNYKSPQFIWKGYIKTQRQYTYIIFGGLTDEGVVIFTHLSKSCLGGGRWVFWPALAMPSSWTADSFEHRNLDDRSELRFVLPLWQDLHTLQKLLQDFWLSAYPPQSENK